MSTQTQSQRTQPRNNTARRTNKRGRGKKSGAVTAAEGAASTIPQQDNGAAEVEKKDDEQTVPNNGEPEEDASVCWICAEPVKYYCLSECNHRTCHICALRLRALYKKLECTFCKHPQDKVVFTTASDALFESFNLEEMQFKDTKLSIFFESQEIMEESLILLRFNCPDPECPFIANGWNDLKVHARAVHGKLMCDLCIRFKKVFAHEHILYPSNQLYLHMPSLSHRPTKNAAIDKVEGGIHPLCEFCRECFFGDDELFSHMRERHEECFVCKRQGVQHQYFHNYSSLETHFNVAHHPCRHPTCLERKFVVFGSLMDLKAHMVEEHGAQMTTKDMRDARRVEVDMEFDDPRGSNGRRRGGREREPPPGPPPAPPEQESSRGSGRRAAFNGALTGGVSGSGISTPAPPRSSPPPPSGEIDPETARKHTAFMARVANLTSDSPSAAAAFKAAIRSYRSSEQSAKDLISIFYTRLNDDLEATSSLITPLIEMLDDDEKKKDLLETFNGFKIEHRQQFPDLTTHGPESAYAGVASGRVLNVKHQTASKRNKGQVWDRVALAASSSISSVPGAAGPSSSRPANRFPVLQRPPPGSATSVNSFRPPIRATSSATGHITPWVSQTTTVPPTTAASTMAVPTARIRTETKKKSAAGAVNLSNSAFPALPSGSTRNKPPVGGNQSLRNIVGNIAPTVNAWSGETNNDVITNDVDIIPPEEPTETNVQQKKGKKKGKEKVTLFTLGTFPS